VPGIPEIGPLRRSASLIADAAPGPADGDIVVITQDRQQSGGPRHPADLDKAIDAETASGERRGPARIAETSTAWCRRAGVDD
jgi:hypothetical protein